MIFILYLYILGIILTGGYIAIQLIQQLPDDIERFRKYQQAGHLSEEDSVLWFVVETLFAATSFSVVFPFFWYLESRRLKR